jgi:hypothetical protein
MEGVLPATGKGPKLAPINARAEILSTSSMFRTPYRRKAYTPILDGTRGELQALRSGALRRCENPALGQR